MKVFFLFNLYTEYFGNTENFIFTSVWKALYRNILNVLEIYFFCKKASLTSIEVEYLGNSDNLVCGVSQIYSQLVYRE